MLFIIIHFIKDYSPSFTTWLHAAQASVPFPPLLCDYTKPAARTGSGCGRGDGCPTSGNVVVVVMVVVLATVTATRLGIPSKRTPSRGPLLYPLLGVYGYPIS